MTRTADPNGPPPPRISIFAIPKPFRGHIGVIQTNAVQSWLHLEPRPQIILFGDEEGTAATAARCGLDHEPNLRRNEHGTPLVSDVFRTAHQRATEELLLFINSDILLLDDFSRAAARVVAAGYPSFLMIGRRTDTNITAPIDFSAADWPDRLRTTVAQIGSTAPRVCKDYFLFRKPLFADIPPFAVGRAAYDNWLVAEARRQRAAVIDATAAVLAVHQNHDYRHLNADRGHAYIHGQEARRNIDLSGGMRLIRGSTTDLILTPTAIRRRRIPSDLVQFAADLPRFLYLVLQLYGWIDGPDPRKTPTPTAPNSRAGA
jgi:hypothetical protein